MSLTEFERTRYALEDKDFIDFMKKHKKYRLFLNNMAQYWLFTENPHFSGYGLHVRISKRDYIVMAFPWHTLTWADLHNEWTELCFYNRWR